MKISSKEDIINHFINGNKSNLYIGVENEKFIFDTKTQKRSTYIQISNILKFLQSNFGWEKVIEGNNLIGLKLNGKQVNEPETKLN